MLTIHFLVRCRQFWILHGNHKPALTLSAFALRQFCSVLPSTSFVLPCWRFLSLPFVARCSSAPRLQATFCAAFSMPPPNRRPRVSRSRSRGHGKARPSARPLTSFCTPEQQLSLSGTLCFECCRIVPVQEIQTVTTRCCEYQCARTDTIDLCAHCFSISWDRFVAESGTFVGLSEEQISQGFSIWMYHKNHCK